MYISMVFSCRLTFSPFEHTRLTLYHAGMCLYDVCLVSTIYLHLSEW